MVIQYSDDDYNTIFQSMKGYTLDPSVIDTILELAKQVGNPEYVKTPQFAKRRSTRQTEDWESIRNFKATKIKKKEGIDASIDTIRKHLNKMTKKTYDKLVEKIIIEMNNICKEKGIVVDSTEVVDDEDIKKIGATLFSIACGSAFLSDMYADLYVKLMTEFNFMKTIFNENFNVFSKLFHSIDYCSPNEDYDKFCENNKTNEKRRAIALFYVNLMIKKAICVDDILDIILQIHNYMDEQLEQDNKSSIVDELSELLFKMLPPIKSHITDDSYQKKWEIIVEHVKYVSQLKRNSKPSITNKSIFKHMDIVDLLDKDTSIILDD